MCSKSKKERLSRVGEQKKVVLSSRPKKKKKGNISSSRPKEREICFDFKNKKNKNVSSSRPQNLLSSRTKKREPLEFETKIRGKEKRKNLEIKIEKIDKLYKQKGSLLNIVGNEIPHIGEYVYYM